MTVSRAISGGGWAFVCASVAIMLALQSLGDPANGRVRGPTPFDANLLRNGGAEAGGSSYPDSVVGKVPHWKRSGRFTVTPYGVFGFLPESEGRRIGGRDQHFACGSVARSARAWQRVDLVGRARATDAGAITAVVRAYVSAPADGGDRGRLIVRFLDGGSRRIGRMASPWVADTASKMVRVDVSAVVPPSTRAFVAILKGVRKQGLYCHVYFDNISVRIVRS